jgi:hypothetical protein
MFQPNILRRSEVMELRRRLEVYMTEIHREHGLINNRSAWLLTSQSFLIAALANIDTRDARLSILLFIPFIGLVMTSSLTMAIWLSRKVQRDIVQKKDTLIDAFKASSPEFAPYIQILIEPWGMRAGFIHELAGKAILICAAALIVFWFFAATQAYGLLPKL